MVQRRAARYVLNRFNNTSSVTNMLENLGWVPLELRRQNCQMTLMYKIVNNLIDVPADQFLVPSYSRTRANHNHKFRQFPTRTNIFKNSFFPKAVPIWNSLPSIVVEAPDLASFKRELSKLENQLFVRQGCFYFLFYLFPWTGGLPGAVDVGLDHICSMLWRPDSPLPPPFTFFLGQGIGSFLHLFWDQLSGHALRCF